MELVIATADTQKMGPLPADDTVAYDGSLAYMGTGFLGTDSDVEARAWLLTEDGGILAEVPCQKSAGVVTIGRGRDAVIRIDDPYVHRLQAEIRWDDAAGAHYIVHGVGESLRFGKTKLLYRIRR